MSTVWVISPRTDTQSDALRVDAYVRVSSDSVDQLNSYRAQVDHYTSLIDHHEKWKLADVYADEGLTGTKVEKG